MANHSGPLNPDARSTLRDVLLPPEGYRLEHCLATAYSLDAETLVTIPLFAAGIAAEEMTKPIGIAHIFETASRMTLLVQGDRINVTKRWGKARALLRLTGDSVVPCSIRGGSFHPKLIVMEFRSVEDEKKVARYRVVVATRNLTIDNSWDSVVVLEQDSKGELVQGLGEAITDLSRFVNARKHPAVEMCRRYGSTLKKIKFQPPRGLGNLEVRLFWPGSNSAERIKSQIRGDDLLVISPFVRSGFLDQLAPQAGKNKDHRWLVTRPVDVPESAFEQYRVFKIADSAVPTHKAIEIDELKEQTQDDAEETQGHLVGLHAKIYVASPKKGATRVVVSSANATSAGWCTNVEVAVSGVATSRAFHVKSILAARSGEPGERAFFELLEEFTSVTERKEPEPPWQRQARRVLSQANVVGRVSKGPPRSIEIKAVRQGLENYWPDGAAISMHPFGYEEHSASATIGPNCLTVRMEIDAKLELTPFVTVVVSTPREPSLEIVLFMQLKGDIDWSREDARKALVQARSDQLLQDLLWHLGVKGGRTSPKTGIPGKGLKQQASNGTGLPLLEKLLLRAHALDAESQIKIIDGLLEGVTDDLEYGKALSETWELVKASLK